MTTSAGIKENASVMSCKKISYGFSVECLSAFEIHQKFVFDVIDQNELRGTPSFHVMIRE